MELEYDEMVKEFCVIAVVLRREGSNLSALLLISGLKLVLFCICLSLFFSYKYNRCISVKMWVPCVILRGNN